MPKAYWLQYQLQHHSVFWGLLTGAVQIVYKQFMWLAGHLTLKLYSNAQNQVLKHCDYTHFHKNLGGYYNQYHQLELNVIQGLQF